MPPLNPENNISYPSLELNEDMAFKRKDWLFERVGWVGMAVVVIAAFLGVFSKGPLSSTTVTDPTGTLSIEYERFQRYQSPTTISIRAHKTKDPLRINLGGDLVKRFEIATIRPQPSSVLLTDTGWVYEFPAPASEGNIQISIQPEGLARASALIGLAGSPPAKLPLFIYP